MGHWGDGGLAVNASLFNPTGVAVDAGGNVYIAEYGGDNYGGTIRIVTPDGNISTIAGSGAVGYSGDGGLATLAALNRPRAVTVDLSRNVYFTDSANGRIRKFIPGGTIGTIAGGGSISGVGADGGLATAALLGGLTRLTVDAAANLYFIENNLTIRKISPAGILSTVAGGGQSAGNGIPAIQAAMLPAGIACDAEGNLYLADFYTSSIREITNGVIATIAGGSGRGFGGDSGPASMAYFNFPSGAVSVDASGDIFVADNENLRIREVSDGKVRTVAGNGLYRLAGNETCCVTATITSLPTSNGLSGNTYLMGPPQPYSQGSAEQTSIFAGNGIFGYSGDNAAAASAGTGNTQRTSPWTPLVTCMWHSVP